MLLRSDQFTRGSGGLGRNQVRVVSAADTCAPRIRAASAERLVKPPDGVVPVGDVKHVIRRPAVVDTRASRRPARRAWSSPRSRRTPSSATRPPPSDPATRCKDPCRSRYTETAPTHADRAAPCGCHSRNVFIMICAQRQRHPHAVAIVVVRDVLSPIDQRAARLVWIRVAIVVDVHFAVVPVHFGARRDQHDQVLADVRGSAANLPPPAGTPVPSASRATRSRANECCRRPSKSARPLRSAPSPSACVVLRGSASARVDLVITVQLRDVGFVRNGDQQRLAAFFRSARCVNTFTRGVAFSSSRM